MNTGLMLHRFTEKPNGPSPAFVATARRYGARGGGGFGALPRGDRVADSDSRNPTTGKEPAVVVVPVEGDEFLNVWGRSAALQHLLKELVAGEEGQRLPRPATHCRAPTAMCNKRRMYP